MTTSAQQKAEEVVLELYRKKGWADSTLPKNVIVRWEPNDDASLPVYDDDPDDAIVILVTGPEFTIRGWMYATDAKKPEYQKG